MQGNVGIIVQKLNGGGAERVAANVSRYLSGCGQKYVIVYDDRDVCYSYGGTLLCVDAKAASSVLLKILNNIKRILVVRRFKTAYRIRSTLSFVENPNLVNILTCKKGERVVVSVRNYISLSERGAVGRLYRRLIQWTYNRSDCVVAVSKLIKADLIRQYGVREQKIKVIYNPIDLDRIRQMAAEELDQCHRELFSHRVIVNVGRFTGQKGQHHLIRVFRALRQVAPDLKLVLMGEGALREDLALFIERCGLGQDVVLLDYQKNPFKFLARSWLYVLSSLYEGFPNALVEAMCCGIPVISTDCKSGPREILAPDTGIDEQTRAVEHARYGVLVPCFSDRPADDPPELTPEEAAMMQAIEELYHDSQLYGHYTEMGAARAEDFGIRKIITEYESVLCHDK